MSSFIKEGTRCWSLLSVSRTTQKLAAPEWFSQCRVTVKAVTAPADIQNNTVKSTNSDKGVKRRSAQLTLFQLSSSSCQLISFVFINTLSSI